MIIFLKCVKLTLYSLFFNTLLCIGFYLTLILNYMTNIFKLLFYIHSFRRMTLLFVKSLSLFIFRYVNLISFRHILYFILYLTNLSIPGIQLIFYHNCLVTASSFNFPFSQLLVQLLQILSCVLQVLLCPLFSHSLNFIDFVTVKHIV